MWRFPPDFGAISVSEAGEAGSGLHPARRVVMEYFNEFFRNESEYQLRPLPN